jgi:hypothetical protein
VYVLVWWVSWGWGGGFKWLRRVFLFLFAAAFFFVVRRSRRPADRERREGRPRRSRHRRPPLLPLPLCVCLPRPPPSRQKTPAEAARRRAAATAEAPLGPRSSPRARGGRARAPCPLGSGREGWCSPGLPALLPLLFCARRARGWRRGEFVGVRRARGARCCRVRDCSTAEWLWGERGRWRGGGARDDEAGSPLALLSRLLSSSRLPLPPVPLSLEHTERPNAFPSSTRCDSLQTSYTAPSSSRTPITHVSLRRGREANTTPLSPSARGPRSHAGGRRPSAPKQAAMGGGGDSYRPSGHHFFKGAF